MKTSSERHDVIILGGSIAGISAAISAAREGVNVALLVRGPILGGLQSPHAKFPVSLMAENSFPNPRNGGIYEEICLEILTSNHEGTHLGQSRVLQEIVREEKRVSLFLNCIPCKIDFSIDSDAIRSLQVIDLDNSLLRTFKSKFFIDCTENSQLANLTPGVSPLGHDLIEWKSQNKPNSHKISSVIHISKAEKHISFSAPSWVRWKWEDNSILAKVDLMESLESSLEGDHTLEWHGSTYAELISSEGLAWCAWDYLKNRSPIAEILCPYYISDISHRAITRLKYRGESVYNVKNSDVLEGVKYPDSVAISCSPLPSNENLQFSARNRVAISKPFEIPLSSLRSSKITNLFWVGDNIFSPAEPHLSLIDTPTLSNLGSACGTAAAFLCNPELNFSSSLFVKNVQASLRRQNQTTSLDIIAEKGNKALNAQVSASSTYCLSAENSDRRRNSMFLKHCLLQLPIQTTTIDEIELVLLFQQETLLEVKLMEGSSYNSVFPGRCLYSERFTFAQQDETRTTFPVSSKISKVGWHYLEIQSDKQFGIQIQDDAPYGITLHKANPQTSSKIKNTYSQFQGPTANDPQLTQGPVLNVKPKQDIFSPRNMINSSYRPSHLPNLWISQETEFKYPEFVELNWAEPISVKQIDITFDAAYNYHFPDNPQRYKANNVHPLIKDYNIYLTDVANQSKKILEIRDNRKSLNSHTFSEYLILGLEVEILSTYGLNRAQIYQIRVF